MPLPTTPITITSTDNNVFSGVVSQLYAGPNLSQGQSLTTALVVLTFAAAATGSSTSVSLTVATGSVLLPAGAVITTVGGKTFTIATSTTVTTTATTVPVVSLAAAISSGDTANYSPFVLIPGLESIGLTVKGDVEKVKQFGNVWARAAKNGLEGSFKLAGVAPSANPVIADLIQAGLQPSPQARRSFLLSLPDGGFFYGFGTVGDVSPALDPRKTFRYDFAVETDGAWQFQAGTLT